jgi:hypothetical protein
MREAQETSRGKAISPMRKKKIESGDIEKIIQTMVASVIISIELMNILIKRLHLESAHYDYQLFTCRM